MIKLKSNYHKMTKEQLINELEEMRQQMTNLVDLESECRLLFEKSKNQGEKLRSLNKNLVNRNKELKIINAITHATHESFDLEKVYKVALDMTVDLDNVDIVMIYLIDRFRYEAVLQSYRNLTEDYILRAGRIPYGRGVTWKVINLGQVVNIEDIQKDENIGYAGKDLGHHGALGIPIILERVVMGVIWFCSYKKRKLDKEEIGLLTSVGSQIGIAIAKAKLYKELTKKSRYEKIISTVTKSVHQSIDLQEVLENAVDSISKNIDSANNVGVYLTEGNEAVLKAHRGLPDWFVKKIKRIPLSKGFIGKTIREGKAIYVADVDKDTIIGPAGREFGTKSYLSKPIKHAGTTVGAIGINSFQKNVFDEEELKLLRIVVQQIEIAINNARQAEALQRTRNELEDRVKERTTELTKANILLEQEITERKQAEQKITESHEQMRVLAARLQSVRDEEKSRIAREIHDDLGQLLTGLKMELSMFDKKLNKMSNGVPILMEKSLASMFELIDTTIQKVQEISTELRPGVLDTLGLVAAIEWQAQQFQRQTGISCKLALGPDDEIDLDTEQSTAIFRIFQETLTNIARHANSKKVRVGIKKKSKKVILEISDNGRGITESEITDPKSLGLLGMQERARVLGGEIEIRGAQGKGTKITAVIPIK